MFPTSKRSRSPSPPPPLKKARVEEEYCTFCWFSKDKTKDEGQLRKFKIKNTEIYVHDTCLIYSGKTSSKETDAELVKRVSSKPSNYKCKSDRCACKKITGATVGCCNKKCRQVYHYRCALTNGTMLPSGHFFCSKHTEEADAIVQGFKETVNWPGDVPYLYDNDWSGISPEDRKLIASSTSGWDTWADTHQPCVRIVRVERDHWAWTENMPYDLQAIEVIKAEEAICFIVGKVRKVDKHKENPDHYTDVYLPKRENKLMSTFTEALIECKLTIDSSKCGNEGRYVNFLTAKAKQQKLKPNCHVLTVWSMGRLKEVLIALTDIQPHDSIILDDASVFSLEVETSNSEPATTENINNNNSTLNNKKIRNQNQNNQNSKRVPFYASDGDDDELDSDDANDASGYEASPPATPAANTPQQETPKITDHSPSPNTTINAKSSSSNSKRAPSPSHSRTSNGGPAPSLSPSPSHPSTSKQSALTSSDDDFHPVTIDHINHTTITHNPSKPSIAPAHSSSQPPDASSKANAAISHSRSQPISTPSHSGSTSKSTTPSSNSNPSSESNDTASKWRPAPSHSSSQPNTSSKSKSTSSRSNSQSNTTPKQPNSQSTPQADSSPPNTHAHSYNTRKNNTPVAFLFQNGRDSDASPPSQTSPSPSPSPSNHPHKDNNNSNSKNTNIDNETNAPKSRTGNSSNSHPSIPAHPNGKKASKSTPRSSNNNNNTATEDTDVINTSTNTTDTPPNANDITNLNENTTITTTNSNENEVIQTNSELSPSAKEVQHAATVIGPIDAKIRAILDQYKLDVICEHTLNFDTAPLSFFRELQKLEAECTSALNKELQDHQLQVEIAKEMQQVFASKMEKAAPIMKEKLRLEFAAIENELAKKEQSVVLEELKIRHATITLTFKRAIDGIDALHTDMKLSTVIS